MKIKIGNKVYDSADSPIMVILTKADKANIKNMDPDCSKYCEYQKDDYTTDEIWKWMEDPKE
jgi:hypothetical protein